MPRDRRFTTSLRAGAATALILVALAGALPAQDAAQVPSVAQVDAHMGEMSVTMPPGAAGGGARETLRFEPWEMLDDLFRKDIVLLMRHGPTDWSKLDAPGVAPTDCANQRALSPEGAQDMRDLGILLAGNGVRPGKVVVSQWCRNQQTLERLREGFASIDPDHDAALEVETDPGVNLLLSLRGARDVSELRALVSSWTGEGADGPLLVLTHFTNIAELTDFHVYEGEILVIDPKRGDRVLGYLRLRDAAPDLGHFDVDNADITR